MRRETHNGIAKRLLPAVDPKLIDKVNSAIDNPPRSFPSSTALGRIPGLDYRGHRKKGHDLASAAAIGLLTGGIEGAEIAGIHLTLDLAKDQVRKRTKSAPAANIVEDLINIGLRACEKNKSGNRKRRKK